MDLSKKNQNKLYFLHLIDILNDLCLPDNMLDKLKVDDIKNEIMSELQKSMELFFQNELWVFKKKCEEFETQMGWFTMENWIKKSKAKIR